MTQSVDVQPGWYDDGHTPGVVRWFDGAAWTEHTTPVPPPEVPQPVAAGEWWGSSPSSGSEQAWAGTQGRGVPQGWGGPQAWGGPGSGTSAAGFPPAATYGTPVAGARDVSGGVGREPSDVVHWLLPTGRSWQSIVAGYLGLLALFLWPLAPFSLALGVWALVRGQHGGHGRGRAVFAIVAGLLGVVLGIAFLTGALTGA